jgi:hypothetical protein
VARELRNCRSGWPEARAELLLAQKMAVLRIAGRVEGLQKRAELLTVAQFRAMVNVSVEFSATPAAFPRSTAGGVACRGNAVAAPVPTSPHASTPASRNCLEFMTAPQVIAAAIEPVG